MIKKIINKIIMGTKCYLQLKERFTKLEDDITEYQNKIIDLQNLNTINKTKVRKIIKLVNSLLKKDEIVPTQKEIKALCNEIIKGE